MAGADLPDAPLTELDLAGALDRAGLGPIQVDHLRILESADGAVLVQADSGDPQFSVYAVLDAKTLEPTSFVPVGTFKAKTEGGAYLFVEPDKVLAYRKGWTSMHLLRGSELNADQTYATAPGPQLRPDLALDGASTTVAVQTVLDQDGAETLLGPHGRISLTVPGSEDALKR